MDIRNADDIVVRTDPSVQPLNTSFKVSQGQHSPTPFIPSFILAASCSPAPGPRTRALVSRLPFPLVQCSEGLNLEFACWIIFVPNFVWWIFLRDLFYIEYFYSFFKISRFPFLISYFLIHPHYFSRFFITFLHYLYPFSIIYILFSKFYFIYIFPQFFI